LDNFNILIMGLFTDASEWKPIYQLETTDPVIGGAPTYNGSDLATAGYANAAAKRLTNRTKFLLDGVANATLIANGAYPASKRNAVLSGNWDNTSKLPAFLRLKPSTTTILQLQSGTVLTFAAGFDATTGRAIDYIVKLTSNVEVTPTYSSGATRYIIAERNATTGAVTISALSVKPVVSYIEPDPSAANMVWFNLSDGVSYKNNGTIWVASQYCLIGEIKFTTSGSGFTYVKAFDINPRDIGVIRAVALVSSVAAYPSDSYYLTCDGTAVSRQTYAELFQRIGTAYGSGDGSTTFNLPDFSLSTESTGTPTTYLTYQIKYQ
jgi:hypothetical protein